MTKETLNNIRLGIFVSAGLLILIVSLYLIGKNQNFFGSNFNVRVRFNNISGLVTGNNVRYSGIQAGTVSKIQVMDDTTIEVTLLINKKIKPYIHQNTIAAIGNDGLMGNKVINLTPNRIPAPEIVEGGLLYTKKVPYTDEMMETLSNTNNNVKVLSERLIVTVDKINNSNALWSVLNDTTLPQNLKISMSNIRDATVRIKELSGAIDNMAKDMQDGKGPAGVLLTDKKVAEDMKQAIANINDASKESKVILERADSLVRLVQQDISNGHGAVHAVLRDTALVTKLNNSMTNIEKGTAAFNQDMEALKHNFLTKGYFKKEAKRNKKAAK
ncbi:MAG: MlaD family protein [Chitinophagales bacterium]